MCVLLFQCRENKFGREIYKLCVFNFLTIFCDAFLLNYPRKWVCLTSPVAFSLNHRCGQLNYILQIYEFTVQAILIVCLTG